MLPNLRSLGLIFVLIALFVSSCAPPSSKPTPQPFLPTFTDLPTVSAISPKSTFEPITCPFDTYGDARIWCGTLTVPEDRSQENIPSIQLRVGVVKSRASQPLPDPLVFIIGPYNITRFMFGVGYIFDTILEKRDVIVVDQRGASTAQPDLSCPEVDQAFWDTLEMQLNTKPVIDANAGAVSACQKRIGGLTSRLGAYTTSAAVQDLEDLRQLLKYKKVNVYGSGYGARLAIQWAQAYPESVRTLAAESATPPGGDVYVEQVQQLNRMLQSFFQACADSQNCAKAFPDLDRVFTRLVEDLNAHPEKVPVDYIQDGKHFNMEVDGNRLIDLVVSVLNNGDPDTLAQLPQMVFQAQERKYTILATMLANYINYIQPAASAVYQNVVCGEYPAAGSKEKVLAEIKNVPAAYSSYLTRNLEFNTAVCASWDVKLAPQQPPKTSGPSLIPALVLLGSNDLAPRQQWSDQASGLFQRVYLVEFNGIGGIFSPVYSSCAKTIFNAFLEDPSVPPESTCAEKKQTISWITFKQ